MKLPVKAAYGQVKRRFSIESGLSFSELSDQIASVFALTPPFSLTYQDNEGDYIAVSTDTELNELFRLAEHESITLLRVFVNADAAAQTTSLPTPQSASQPQPSQTQAQTQTPPQPPQPRQQSRANAPPSFFPPHVHDSFRRAEASMDAAQFNVDRVLQSVGNFLRDIGSNPHPTFAQPPPPPPPMPSWNATPPPFRHPPPPPRHHRARHRRRREGPFGMFGGMGFAPFFSAMYPFMSSQGGPEVSQATRDAFEQLKNAVMSSDNTDVAFQAARNAFPALRNWLISNLGQSGPINSESIDSLISTVERSIRPSVGDDITNRTTHLLRTALNDSTVVEILRKIPWNMDLPIDIQAEFDSAFYAPDNDMPFQTHVNVECDNCEKCPIVGNRYQATNRANYDLCSKCYEDAAVSKEGIEFKKLSYVWEVSLGDAKVPNAPLSLRSRGANVAFLQKLLTDLGYMNESMYRRVVGMYGPRTRSAVSQFQREYGLDGTAQLGVYDDITAASMASMLEDQVPPTAATGGTSTPAQDTGPVPPTSAPDPAPAQG